MIEDDLTLELCLLESYLKQEPDSVMTSRRIYHVNTGCDGGDEHIRSDIRCEFRKMMSVNKGLILGFLVSAPCHPTKCGH
jgi:hypothetical protein